MVDPEKRPHANMMPDSDSDFDIYFEYLVGSYRPAMLNKSREWHPAADVYETDTCVMIKVDIAGIDKKDVQLTLDKDRLTLQGVRHETVESDRKRMLAMEVPYGAFRRVFELPAPVCADNATADYKDGMLTIRLRKREKPLQRKMVVKIY